MSSRMSEIGPGAKPEDEDVQEEFKVEDIQDTNGSSGGNRFAILARELGLRAASRDRLVNGFRGFLERFVISPDNRFGKEPVS